MNLYWFPPAASKELRPFPGRELAAPPLLEAEAPGDGVEPGRDRRGAPEVPDAARHRQQRILQDVLRIFWVPAHLHAEAIDLRLVTLEQRLERLPVASPRVRQEALVRRRFPHRAILPDHLSSFAVGDLVLRRLARSVDGELDRR